MGIYGTFLIMGNAGFRSSTDFEAFGFRVERFRAV